MRENDVKRRLAQGGTAFGILVFEFATSGFTRTAASAGAEFVLFDLEHTGWSIETIRSLMATARASDVVPCVRVPATEYHLIARPLDVGAVGIMVPDVKTEEQARRIVDYARYPPLGHRGVGILYSDSFEDGDLGATMESANREQWLIALIESPEGVENAAAIAAVEGIDLLWVGYGDLTTTMGIPGQFDHPDYLAAIDELLAISVAHNKPLAIMVTNTEQGVVALEKGFRCLGFGDLWLFEQALRGGLSELRSAATS